MWDWNVDSLDWKYKSRYSLFLVKKRTLRMNKAKVRPVILFHDLERTAKMLPKILKFLKKKGYTFNILTTGLKPVQFVKSAYRQNS